ncbi:hypothetical protein ACFSQ7_12325 [Paenibacillus rhizoplanae]
MSDKPLLQKQSVAWTGILSDVLLAVAKGSIGYLSGSKALLGGMQSIPEQMPLPDWRG